MYQNISQKMDSEGDPVSIFSSYLMAMQYKENFMDKEIVQGFVVFLNRSYRDSVLVDSTRKSDLLKIMLNVLGSGILHLEDQVLLSTAFCLLLKSAVEKNKCGDILNKCTRCSHPLLSLPSLFPSPGDSIVIKDVINFRIALSLSILQCFDVHSMAVFYDSNSSKCESEAMSSFAFIFELLESQCNMYTAHTFISFKIIPIWLNRLVEMFAHTLLDESSCALYLKRVINIVCCNWESPVPGVKDKNVEILRTVFIVWSKISPTNQSLENALNLCGFLGTVLRETPWRMKSKYLMLTSLLNQFGVKKGLVEFPSIPRGLVYSLSYPHLVSAGADCYQCLLKGMEEALWQKHFYSPFIKQVMMGKDGIAVSNLMSYWMPVTLKAFPLVMNQILYDVTHEINPSSMFSVAALYRIGRKSGLLKWERVDCALLKACLVHVSEDVRGEAFAAACVCPKVTSLPSESEMEMVRLFLEENINVDSSKLRQVMVSSFKTFICRIKGVHFRLCSENHVRAVADSERVLGFFRWLLEYIIGNFVPGVNYQRRITCLLLLRVVLDGVGPGECSTEEAERCVCRLRDDMSTGWKGQGVLSLLMNQALMDSVADVRDAASGILRKHFQGPGGDLFLALWEKALALCASSLFYEIESGVVLAESLIRWRLCSGGGGSGVAGVEQMMDDLLSRAEEERRQLEANVLRGAVSAPVHGTLTILNRIISSPEVLANLDLSKEHVTRLMELIDGLIAFALGALSSKPHSQVDVAPSFAEMGIAIDVAVSEHIKYLDNFEAEGVEPSASELVLNCLWLNMKACCALACTLSQRLTRGGGQQGPLMSDSDVEACGRLLVRVLTKCRHKGAIESAGKSLSSFAVSCVSSPNAKVRALPQKMLSECLERTFGRGGELQRTSVTRRSAGLSILVHKLIAADAKNAVQVCVPKLLQWAEMELPPGASHAEREDLPQAQALHFLRPIVQDSAMLQHLSPHLSEITLVCFRTLSSQVWTIRNAALQLFGAVTPKLIGQKKGQVEDVVGSNVTIEELLAHHPQLFDYMLKELRESVSKLPQPSAWTTNSLLPILTLCSRMTRGAPPMLSIPPHLSLEFLSLFQSLLPSPCIAIRRACAKAIAAFTPLSQVSEKIKSFVNDLKRGFSTSENELHGKLICIQTLRDRLEVDSYLLEEYILIFKEIEELLLEINISEEQCYFTRALLCQIQGFTNCDVLTMLRMFRQKSPLSYSPVGWMQWVAASLECSMMTCSDDHVIPMIESCVDSGEYFMQAGMLSLTKRLEKKGVAEGMTQELMDFLAKVCLSNPSISTALEFLNSMLRLCSNSSVTLSLNEVDSLFLNFVTSYNYGIGCTSVALAVISTVLVRCEDCRDSKLMTARVVTAIHKLSLPSNLEEIRLDMVRMLASYVPMIQCCRNALQQGRGVDIIIGEIISSLLGSAIVLLQDENSIIRTEAAKFVSTFIAIDKNDTFTHIGVNSQRCINILLTGIASFLPSIIAGKFLWANLTSSVKPQFLLTQHGIRSPFDHGMENIYSEKVIIAKLSGETLKVMINSDNSEFSDLANLINTSQLLETGAILLLHMTEKTGATCHAYSELYLSVVSIKYQLETTILLGVGDSPDLQSLLSRLERTSTDFFNREMNW